MKSNADAVISRAVLQHKEAVIAEAIIAEALIANERPGEINKMTCTESIDSSSSG